MSAYYRKVTMDLKAARRAVNAGQAAWRPLTPRGVAVAAKAETTASARQWPARKPTRPFGEGLGERHPIHRAPVSISDMEWWAEESRRAEERELEQRYGEFVAESRLEAGCCF